LLQTIGIAHIDYQMVLAIYSISVFRMGE
jgi:hypothetical protein